MEEIELWNPAWGLVNASGDELAIKHVLDSLAPLGILKSLLAELDGAGLVPDGAAGSSDSCPHTALSEGQPASAVTGAGKAVLADIGTGAGLPGIPLALAMPERSVVLVERMGKRIGFLRNQKALLGLKSVSIQESEAERARGPFDLVVFRAFRPFTETRLFRAILTSLAPGGIIAAYKGKSATASEELSALQSDARLGLMAADARILPVRVPFLDDERCLVVMRKPRV